MTSYHDLEDQTYRSVVAEDVTRIYGKPAWQAKERLKTQLGKIAIKHKVSYEWSGGKGLVPLIVGSARWAADYPTFPRIRPINATSERSHHRCRHHPTHR